MVTAVALAVVAGGLPGLGAGRAAAREAGQLREFSLVAEPVRWEIQPGLVVDGWGYNGGTPGPTIRVTEGDRVRVTLVNHLPVPTTIHWHGIDVPLAQDGVPGLSQDAVEPGNSFTYEFTATNPGTRWYHSHVDSNMQIQLGLFGAFIVDPRTPEPVQYDREFTYLLSEKALDVTPAVALGEADVNDRAGGNGRGGAFIPDLFLMNGRAGSAIDPATIAPGGRIRIRMINAGNQVHAMHTHGHSFKVIATDGNPVPPAAQLLKDTVLIGPAERVDIEVDGTNHGVWMFHCHINNHSANGMVTELVYDGAQPLAGGDHSASHSSAAPATAGTSTATVAPPAAGHDHGDHAMPSATSAAATVAPATTATLTTASSSQAATPATRSAEDAEVKMTDDRFRDGRVTVKVGTTVTWENTGSNLHTTSSLDAVWDSGSVQRGGSFRYMFDTPGTYAYICRLHLLQGMRGTIVVEPND
jgi:FtsP/CotA-like multicopper oxidase with cupredoxin domain